MHGNANGRMSSVWSSLAFLYSPPIVSKAGLDCASIAFANASLSSYTPVLSVGSCAVEQQCVPTQNLAFLSSSRVLSVLLLFCWSHTKTGIWTHSGTGRSAYPGWPDLVMDQFRMLIYYPGSVCTHLCTTLFYSGIICPHSIIHIFAETFSLLCIWLIAPPILPWSISKNE